MIIIIDLTFSRLSTEFKKFWKWDFTIIYIIIEINYNIIKYHSILIKHPVDKITLKSLKSKLNIKYEY